MRYIVSRNFYSRGKMYKAGDAIELDAEIGVRWAAYLTPQPAVDNSGSGAAKARKNKMVGNSIKKG